MAVYPGRNGIIYMSSSGTGAASPVLHMSAWSIDRTQDTIETTSFGDPNKTYVPSLPDVQGTISGFWDDAETKIIAGALSSDGVKLYIYPSTNAPSKYAYGPAWISPSFESGVGDAVTVSIDFSANGAWGFNL